MKKEQVKYEKRMVEAVELGHCGKKLRKPGEKFEFAGAPAAWFKDVEAKAAADEKPAAQPEGAEGKGKKGGKKPA